MSKLIYLLSNSVELLHKAEVGSEYYKVYLNDLHKGTRHNSNLYGEGRMLLMSSFDLADVVGFANARWNSKYAHLATRLEHFTNYADLVTPTTVYAPWTCKSGWLSHTLQVHPTMKNLLDELSEFAGIPLRDDSPTLWANDLVASREVIESWLAFWRKCFMHFDGKYGALLPMAYYNMDPARGPAYFYERVSALYFASRSDLNIIQIL